VIVQPAPEPIIIHDSAALQVMREQIAALNAQLSALHAQSEQDVKNAIRDTKAAITTRGMHTRLC
jgi:hypothetical protein